MRIGFPINVIHKLLEFMVTKGGAPLVFQLPHQRAVSVKNAVYDDTRLEGKCQLLVQSAGPEQTLSPGEGEGGGGVR